MDRSKKPTKATTMDSFKKATTTDKISELPESIVHHILNFLTTREAARNAVLSKTWKSLVNLRPVLKFKQSHYINFGTIDTKTERLIKEPFLMKHIDDSIQRLICEKVSILKFGLRTESYYPDRWDSHMNRWMHQLVNEAGVNELWLNLNMSPKPDYTLPSIIFRSKTITRLTLFHCNPKNCDTVKLPNLFELDLRSAELSQEMISNLISGSPSMEILKLACCSGLFEICISGLFRLKRVELIKCFHLTKVKIVASQLRVFKFEKHLNEHETHIKPCEIDLSACELTLKTLSLSNADLTKDLLKRHVSKFTGLEKLTVSDQILESVEISNHRKLRKLFFTSCKKLSAVKIDAPNLQCLRYKYNKLPFYSINCPQLSGIELDFFAQFDHQHKFTDFCDNYKECFMKFGHFKDIKLLISDFKHMIVCEDCENLLTMLHALKDKYPEVNVKVICVSYECIADYMFKWRRFRTVSLVSRHHNANDLLKTLEKKKLKENEEPNCCRYTKNEICWRHHFYDFEKMPEGEEEKPNLSHAAMGYKTTKFKLQWI